MMKNDIRSLSEKTMNQLTDFFLRLFQKCNLDNNVIVSPVSAFFILGLISIGAKGETLKQLENMVGMSSEEFIDAVRYLGNLLNWCHTGAITTANAILQGDRKHIRLDPSFLGKAERISLWLDKFEGPDCMDRLNDWIDRLTCGMIKKVIDHTPEDLTVALFNVITFKCKWEKAYEEDDIYDEDFTSAFGVTKEVKMLHSEEKLYYEDEDIVGVMKPYKGGEYDFVALLPHENKTIPEYVRSLTGEKLLQILSGFGRYWEVETTIPAFTVDSEQELKKIFEEMGTSDAFDPKKADLSGMVSFCDENLYISDLMQKAYIKVDEWGTKAAAVTKMIFGCPPGIRETKEVRLDRPFIYMILERESNIPIFMGTVLDIESD